LLLFTKKENTELIIIIIIYIYILFVQFEHNNIYNSNNKIKSDIQNKSIYLNSE